MHSSGTRTGLSSSPAALPPPKSNHSEYSCRFVGLPTSPSTSMMSGLRPSPTFDLSEIAISDMLCRNACQRPGMKWQVMDITTMQFEDESFDVVVDKSGLDALMEPEFGPKMAINI
ncbi:hypothetical protein L3X38_002720 [Prunus dulcis]|uniref:Methyltransferase type 11 domain-containing protein n=1 Tax=Prunus dulcis TaxID=3755 RepID=A0AAD4WYV5_PRUDU|nr:hypothetical protein L3X38_002720 [Prunus dulcis]